MARSPYSPTSRSKFGSTSGGLAAFQTSMCRFSSLRPSAQCTICRLSAVWLGRPITFRANDYSTALPDISEVGPWSQPIPSACSHCIRAQVDDNEMWQPYPAGILGEFTPQPARLMSSFREACRLCTYHVHLLPPRLVITAGSSGDHHGHHGQDLPGSAVLGRHSSDVRRTRVASQQMVDRVA